MLLGPRHARAAGAGPDGDWRERRDAEWRPAAACEVRPRARARGFPGVGSCRCWHRCRVGRSIARAAYSDASIVLLDDPLSALDQEVARGVFTHAICGEMAGRLRVLVTHYLHLLPQCDVAVVMQDGAVVAEVRGRAAAAGANIAAAAASANHALCRCQGPFAELVARGVDFGQLLGHQDEQAEGVGSDEHDAHGARSRSRSKSRSRSRSVSASGDGHQKPGGDGAGDSGRDCSGERDADKARQPTRRCPRASASPRLRPARAGRRRAGASRDAPRGRGVLAGHPQLRRCHGRRGACCGPLPGLLRRRVVRGRGAARGRQRALTVRRAGPTRCRSGGWRAGWTRTHRTRAI